MFLERAIRGGHHVEVQVVADAKGTVWTLGVRDCSVQRRNQKVVEESASTALDAEQEKMVRSHAAELIRAAGYVNAATVGSFTSRANGCCHSSRSTPGCKSSARSPRQPQASTSSSCSCASRSAARWLDRARPAADPRARHRGPADRRGPGTRLRARPGTDRAPGAAVGPRHQGRHRGRGGRRHTAAVRLHDRQGDRLGPGPRRGPCQAVPRAPPDRHGDQGRDHEQGLPA